MLFLVPSRVRIAAPSIWLVLVLAAFAAATTAAAQTAQTEYRLQIGDVIEVRVAGMPELQQRVTVEGDGEISLPLLGTVVVAGSTTSAARAKIQAALATKVFRLTTADGRERPVMIKFDEVSASVVEYRPIYVQGDVMKPGELTYRPHMTVRQAVGGAGGYYQLRLQTMSAVRDLIDLQGEYAALWTSLARERLLVWRLTSQLGETAELDPKVLEDVPLPKTTLAQLISVEAEHLEVWKSDFQRESAYLTHSIAQSGEQISALEEQQKKENEGTKADLRELERVTDLFKGGNLVMPRITEARRAVLLSTTRQVQTRSQLIQAMRDRTDLTRKLEKLPDELRIGLLKELQEARVRLTTAQEKLQIIGEKLPYAIKPVAATDMEKTPRITVFRNDLRGERTFTGNGDTELQPGDVVAVVLVPSETHGEAVP
jgi:polysaccharide biosynthesis/export protein